MFWQTSRFRIHLSRPLVMGIVNATPDSFSDGGRHAGEQAACAHCDRLLAEGADILDIGGESTRPDATAPDVDEELRRVIPVLRHAVGLGVPVSVDTSQPAVMQAALDLGVDIVNDVRALRRPGALAVLAGHARAGACLMHLRGEPATMRAEADIGYADVVAEVGHFLAERLADCVAAGVQRDRLVADPGYGFAKNAADNLTLLAGQASLQARPGVCRCWRACRARPCSGRSPAAPLPSACPPAWPRRWQQWRTARPSCVCTTWLPPSTR